MQLLMPSYNHHLFIIPFLFFYLPFCLQSFSDTKPEVSFSVALLPMSFSMPILHTKAELIKLVYILCHKVYIKCTVLIDAYTRSVRN